MLTFNEDKVNINVRPKLDLKNFQNFEFFCYFPVDKAIERMVKNSLEEIVVVKMKDRGYTLFKKNLIDSSLIDVFLNFFTHSHKIFICKP